MSDTTTRRFQKYRPMALAPARPPRVACAARRSGRASRSRAREEQARAIGRTRIARFVDGADYGASVAEALDAAGRRELAAWLRFRGPVGQFVTRHSRETLKAYRDAGLLDDPIADRVVEPALIGFTPDEQALYDELDGARRSPAGGAPRAPGRRARPHRISAQFDVLVAGDPRTLQRRLVREQLLLDEGDLEEEAEEEGVETDDSRRVDDTEAVPLTDEDRGSDPRFHPANRQPADRFENGRAAEARRRSTGKRRVADRLHAVHGHARGDSRPPSAGLRAELATFTGQGGREWRDDHGWRSPSVTSSTRCGRDASACSSRTTPRAKD